jgi:hypothetical protein
MELSRELTSMDAEALRNLTATLLVQLADKDAQLVEKDAQLLRRDREIKTKQLKIDQLTHEMAVLKRYRFDRSSEQMDPQQRLLLDESIDADIEAIGLERLPTQPASRLEELLPHRWGCSPTVATTPIA